LILVGLAIEKLFNRLAFWKSPRPRGHNP
jgi:hypothetical protein